MFFLHRFQIKFGIDKINHSTFKTMFKVSYIINIISLKKKRFCHKYTILYFSTCWQSDSYFLNHTLHFTKICSVYFLLLQTYFRVFCDKYMQFSTDQIKFYYLYTHLLFKELSITVNRGFYDDPPSPAYLAFGYASIAHFQQIDIITLERS